VYDRGSGTYSNTWYLNGFKITAPLTNLWIGLFGKFNLIPSSFKTIWQGLAKYNIVFSTSSIKKVFKSGEFNLPDLSLSDGLDVKLWEITLSGDELSDWLSSQGMIGSINVGLDLILNYKYQYPDGTWSDTVTKSVSVSKTQITLSILGGKPLLFGDRAHTFSTDIYMYQYPQLGYIFDLTGLSPIANMLLIIFGTICAIGLGYAIIRWRFG
jgi:hypothetical protein